MLKFDFTSSPQASTRALFSTGLGLFICAWSCVSFGQAQVNNPPYNPILPAQPTSSDNLIAVVNYFHYCYPNVKKNPYTMKMEQNRITVTFNKDGTDEYIPAIPAPYGPPALVLDIGRLPPGNYTFSTAGSPCVSQIPRAPWPSFTDYAFTVTDSRPAKPIPWITQDLSGHWWDPANPGHGVFIHQDAKDNVLATWFTYDANGKDAWHVFQPKWAGYRQTQYTEEAAIWQASKPVQPSGMLGSTQ
jgi:hypothetical protein